jgi:hypothetical protein
MRMKAHVRPSLRWAAVVLFGACGLYIFGKGLSAYWQPQGGWIDNLFIVLLFSVAASPFLWISHACLRQQYHLLVTPFAAVGAVVVVVALMSLPSQIGIMRYLIDHERDHPWLVIIALPLSLLFLFGPFYAARWFFDFCLRLAARQLYGAPSLGKDYRSESM